MEIALTPFPFSDIIAIHSGSPIIARGKVMAWRLKETLFLEGRGMGFLYLRLTGKRGRVIVGYGSVPLHRNILLWRKEVPEDQKAEKGKRTCGNGNEESGNCQKDGSNTSDC